MAPVLVATVAAVGGCGGESETYSVEPTSKCLSATGVRVNWYEEAGEVDPFATSGGALVARGAYDVTVRFGKDAAEAEAVAEKLERHEDLDPSRGASIGSWCAERATQSSAPVCRKMRSRTRNH
jgi:hypothetical protein